MPLPDVGAFERLLPVLEDIDAWAPDAPGWRDGDDAAHPVPRRTLERWRTGFARRKRMRTERIPVVRGGWAPEGSFELDIPTTGEFKRRIGVNVGRGADRGECTAPLRVGCAV
jgi:hypothetical protein